MPSIVTLRKPTESDADFRRFDRGERIILVDGVRWAQGQ